MTWTDERVEVLKNLHADGLTSSQIAARLGVTRCAVCGKLARLGLTRERPAPRTASRARRPTPRPKPGATKAQREWAQQPRARDEQGSLVGLPLPEAQAEDVPRIATLDLEPWHCRWVVGDPIEVGPHAPLFCGLDRVPGSSYCEDHTRRATAPVETRRVDRALRMPVAARQMEPAE